MEYSLAMAYFPDLASAQFTPESQGARQSYSTQQPSAYVGWLAPEEGHEVNIGPTPEGFVEALHWATKRQEEGGPFHDGMAHRGCHYCALCEKMARGGNYTVTIPGHRDFFVPSLIGHYVERHNYKPPKVFVDVVMAHHRDWKLKQAPQIVEGQGTRGVVRRMLTEGDAARRYIAEDRDNETRTYEITAHPEILKQLEEVLGTVALLGSIGASRMVKFSVDGDGRARVRVKSNGRDIRPVDEADLDKDEIRLGGLG